MHIQRLLILNSLKVHFYVAWRRNQWRSSRRSLVAIKVHRHLGHRAKILLYKLWSQ